MLEIVMVICATLLALRCMSSWDKNKDAEILRLKKELRKMGGINNEQRFSDYQSENGFYNNNRK